MAKSNTVRDQQIASTQNSTILKIMDFQTQQTINIVDLISEGPIEGLVDGIASIYLNDDRIAAVSDSTTKTLSNLSITISNNSSSATTSSPLPESSVYVTNSEYINSARQIITILDLVTTNVTVAIGSLSTGPRSPAYPCIEVSAPAGFLASYMTDDSISIRLVNSFTKETLTGELYSVSGDTCQFIIASGSDAIYRSFIKDAGNSCEFHVDTFLEVSAGWGTTNITLTRPYVGPTGTYNTLSGGSFYTDTSVSDTVQQSKYESVYTEFRVGTEKQPPITNYEGTSATSISAGSGFSAQQLKFIDTKSQQYLDIVEEDPTGANALLGEYPVYLSATSGNGFGLTAAQVPQIDEIRLTFTYSSLICPNNKTGRHGNGTAGYKIELKLFRGAVESLVTLNPAVKHSYRTEGAIIIEEVINLEPFKPFTDFEVIITRLTRDSGRGVQRNLRNTKSKYTIQAASTLSSISSVIKEPLSYPHSAYASISFSSKDFSAPPTRTYHCRGIKVKVPSNYTTREEAGSDTPIYDGFWDGSFRTELVYTNNPAWIFYDIVTNNRYGIGSWVSEDDIDKYALYRIARYCDELVPDGKGGVEPRFTLNVYLTKATDVYKVLKDIASAFVTILYWSEGKIYPSMDRPKDPVYTFSRSNVIDGEFVYESTGEKTRVNQVIVSWNNPDANYALEPLIVEDRESIVETGKIIQQNVVAFGATSEGQATRYGRWKLWTAINQTNIINFSTSLNAAFLNPGDIIRVQDAAKYKIELSGRLINATVDQLVLDRPINLDPQYTYELSVLIPENTAFLSQKQAVIGGVTYTSAEPLPSTLFTSEEEASSIEDDFGNPVSIYWAPYTRVETRQIDVTTTETVTQVSLSLALSLSPPPSSVWTIKKYSTAGLLDESAKDYKILSIKEESKEVYSISAVEHYNEKFAAIDEEFSLYVPDTVFPAITSLNDVPNPKSVFPISISDYKTIGEEIQIGWLKPRNANNTEYEYVSGYEISHDIPGYPSPIFVGPDVTTYTFVKVPEDVYRVGVRTINSTKKKSIFTYLNIEVDDPFSLDIPRESEGIGLGGVSSSSLMITDENVLRFEKPETTLSPAADPAFTIDLTSESLDLSSPFLLDNVSYYILFDVDLQQFRAIKYFEAVQNTHRNYWYDVISSGNDPQNAFTQVAGTVTLYSNSTFLRGTGTSFLNDLRIRDKIKIDSGYGYYYVCTILSIISDTIAVIDRSFNQPIDSQNLYLNTLRFEFEEDTIVAKITKKPGLPTTLVSYLTVDPSLLDNIRSASLISATPQIKYNGYNELTSSAAFSIKAIATGFSSPEFKITGAGFTQVDEAEDSVFVFTGAGEYEKSLNLTSDVYSAEPLVFQVEIREQLDPNNATKTKVASLSIEKVRDGTPSLTGSLTNETQFVNAAFDGSDYDLSIVSSVFNVYQGVGYLSSLGVVTFTVGDTGTNTQTKNGLTLTIDSFGEISVSEAQQDDWITNEEAFSIVASYEGETITKLFTIKKLIQDFKLGELSDVDLATVAPTTGQSISYDDTTKLWSPYTPFSGNYNDLSNLPTLFSGSYTDLTNKPTIAEKLTDLSDVTISNPQNNQLFSYNATLNKWENATVVIPYNIGDLNNVSTNSLNNGQVLVYQNGTWVNESITYPSLNLGDLDNVTTNSLSNGQVIVYRDGTWVNEAQSGGFSGSYNDLTDKPTLFSGSYTDLTDKPTIPTNLGDLGNVTTNALNNGQVIVYRDGTWVNEAITYPSLNLGDLDNVTTNSLSNGQVIVYRDGTWVNEAQAGGIALTDLSVGDPNTASGSGAIAYNDTTGVFTYTPPDLSGLGGGIALTDLSVGAPNTASGSGAIAYNDTTGVFTYTPPDLSNFHTKDADVDITTYNLNSSTTGNFLNLAFSGASDSASDVLASSVRGFQFLLDSDNSGTTSYFGISTNKSSTATDISLANCIFSIQESGDVRAIGNITAYYTSDINLKENIINIPNALQKLETLDGVTFEWKDSVIEERGGEDDYFVRKDDVGVIAQQVQEILPEAVAERQDGTLAVRYESLIPLLIESIKELSARVKELENK
jgi:predicted phage tail protein